MDYKSTTKKIFDEQYSKEYREGDEIAVTHGSRIHYCDLLTTISQSFGKKINVLDAGCGSGRYFHCLKNTQRLVGLDISEHMLKQAQNPVAKDRLDIEMIDLFYGDIITMAFPHQSFDFVYSIGVLGEYSPINEPLLDVVFELLSSEGILFFTTVDTHSRMQVPEKKRVPIQQKVLQKFFLRLPRCLRRYLNRILSSYYMTQGDLEALMAQSRFARYTITQYKHLSGWQGVHFDCIALKKDND